MLDVADVSLADHDTRYVPSGQATLDFCSVAHESRYHWVIDRFDLSGKKVLDFGCGSGYGTALLASRAATAVGVDKSSIAIEFARRKYRAEHIQFFAADACSNDLLSDQRFDFIVSFDVIEHLERYFDYLENAVRLLNPGGTFVVGCPNRLQTFAWNRLWNPYHFQEFSPYQFRKILPNYFRNVTLIAQDFKDQGKREEARRQNYGTGRRSMRSFLPEFLRKPLRPLARRVRTAVSESGGFQCHDIAFIEEPGDKILDSSFGLLAICR